MLDLGRPPSKTFSCSSWLLVLAGVLECARKACISPLLRRIQLTQSLSTEHGIQDLIHRLPLYTYGDAGQERHDLENQPDLERPPLYLTYFFTIVANIKSKIKIYFIMIVKATPQIAPKIASKSLGENIRVLTLSSCGRVTVEFGIRIADKLCVQPKGVYDGTGVESKKVGARRCP